MTPLLLEKQVEELGLLTKELQKSLNKLEILNEHHLVKDFFSSSLPSFFKAMTEEEEVVVKSIVAIGQGRRVFSFPASLKEAPQRFKELMQQLIPVERFYAELGGIVGYHWRVLSLMSGEEKKAQQATYHRPKGIDISRPTADVVDAILTGIKRLSDMAEIYPVGGAADRLRLHDERTGVPLPAAKLIFCGKTLLEWLICDLQAREYLHYKLFGIQLTTPVAMMTSQEKDNHAQIHSICEEKRWFSRPKESFRFFCQPSVPAINRSGQWCLQGHLRPLLKPGGHGMIWKLARDEKVFDWLFDQGRKKALIRQINNPMASCDHGLLAFSGLGCKEDRLFGFASCQRHVKASEGVNVLIERDRQFILTNIEYCDFKKFQIIDEPVEKGSPYSKFSSNTNILFADLKSVFEAVAKVPLPGMLLNFKRSTYRLEEGGIVEEEMARLETTMQNIADEFQSEDKKELQTFITYNERRKTISTVKREYALGSSLLETPEGCFLDLLKNAEDLLVNYCRFAVPEVNDAATFFAHGPSFIFLYHPALGPLYSIIAQKVRWGRLKKGSELLLEIAELDLELLDLEGSLCIRAEALMGHEEEGILKYSEATGKCVLKNIKVRNQGVDWEASNVFWREGVARREALSIRIKGDGEFYAEDLLFEGDWDISVEAGTKVIALMESGKVVLRSEPLSRPSWHWNYELAEEEAHLIVRCAKK